MTSSALPAFLSGGSKDPADEAVASVLLSRDVYIENVKVDVEPNPNLSKKLLSSLF
jgi:hypothetical protein